MADEDITLDGKPLQSLRVADLKAALEQRNLPKSGQKNALIKRLKGALMLENLQRSSSSHIGLQPNSQIGEEMSQNSFIKQYLAKQQELLRQRLEREAQQAADEDESPTVTEEDDDHTEGNDNSSYFSDKPRPMPSQPPLSRAEEEGGGLIMGQGLLARRPNLGPGSMHHHQDSPDVPGVWMQRPSLQLGHEKPSTPSPPRAVASLSVRVVGQPDRQGLPPVMPRAQEKEGTAPAEPGSAQSVLQLSRSARAVAGGRPQEDSDDDDDDDDDSDSEEDEEWGAGPGGARRGVRAPPQPQPPSLSVPPGASRSRRKLQPPQHIPPPQVHQPPMQLRHPTPPPSPPPELSFPLPDTPKQSPPDTDELEGLGPRPGAGPGVAARPPPAMQRQDSDSSSRSSSPEPPLQRRPGPLSLLVRKMESEGAFPAAEPPAALGMSGGMMPHSAALSMVSVGPSGSNETPAQRMAREQEREKREKEEKERQLREEKEREQRREEEKKRAQEREKKRLEEEEERERKRLEEEKKKRLEEEKKKRLEEEREKERKRLQEEKDKEKRRLEEEKEKERKQLEEKEKERKRFEEEREKEMKRLHEKRNEEERERENRLPPWKRGQDLSAAAQLSETRAGSGDSAMDQGSALFPQTSKKPGLSRDALPQRPLSSPPPISVATATTPSPTARKPRMFSDTPAGSLVSPIKTDRVSVVVTKDSGSSSDSDSGSDSSSSRSSSSSQDKSRPTRQPKKANQGKETGDKKAKSDKGEGRRYPTKREVSEPSTAAVTEVDADCETSMAQSASEANPENSEGRPEESTTPKAFAARKISLTAGSKTSPVSTEGGAGGAGDSEAGGAAGRKRRWGSSTAVTTKKPSISITTDSLKSLIPDIKVNQEAVVELHPDELQLSGEEDAQGLDSSRDDQDKGLKIRRTVTQVVTGDSQENGQRNEEEEEEEKEKKTERDRQRRASKDKRKNSHSEETMETQSSTKHDAEATKVTPSDSLVRRSISQQKSGVSVTIDDPVRTARQPSPPRGKVSNIVHITNLVRPFTLAQLKELLNRTGSVVEEGFWIDKIKSHCCVTYATAEEAVATRTALHGVKWPQSNPKVLAVDFCEQDELDFHRGLLKTDRANEDRAPPPATTQVRLPPLMPERDRDRGPDRDRGVLGVRDQWAEREREMQRRERARGEREWDRDKIREFARPGEDGRRSRSRDREKRRRERAKSKERKSDKKEKADEPPAKLLDDLFRKTKAAPCIYWLPLSEEQVAQRDLDRAERLKERERRWKELEEEDKKREEERKERVKGRDKEVVKGREKEGGSTAGGGGGGGRAAAAPAAAAPEGDRDRERERDRGGHDREGDKKREGYRPRGPSGGAGSGRRSHSRSNPPRDRRR